MAFDANYWAHQIARFCVFVVATVAIFDVVFYYNGWFPSEIVSRSFNVAIEESYGTWVSTSLALLTGLVGLLKAQIVRTKRGIADAIPWLFVGLFFLFISFDDAAKFHERVGSALQFKVEDVTQTELVSWFPSWGWQLYVAPVFILIGLWLCWFFFTELPRIQWLISLLGFGLFALAVGMDFVEGMVDRTVHEVHLLRLAEEVAEMLGQTAFLYLLLITAASELTVPVTFTRQTSER